LTRFAVIAEQELLSVSKAGRLAGVSPSAATRWIVSGAALRDGTRLKLKAIRLPGGFRTTRQWLDEFIEALTRDRTGAPAPSELVEARAERSMMSLQAQGW
jgi:hypothetical protein